MMAVHVISGRMFGGGQQVVQDLMHTLPKVADVKVRLCLLGQKNNFLSDFDPIVISYDGNLHNPLSLLRCACKLRRFLREESPEVLHTHGYDAELIGALAAWGLATKHISHIHDTPTWVLSSKTKHRVRRALTSHLLRNVDTRWIACCEVLKQIVCEKFGWPSNVVYTVRNGVNLDRFAPSSGPAHTDRPVVIGSAARLTPGKGIEILLQAVSLLHKQGIPFELFIAGEGPSEPEYCQVANRLGIAQQVRFLGCVNNTPEFYRGLDIFVLASEREGLPLTILEAMASGLPVIATAVGGVPEAINNNVNGFLIPPRDSWALFMTLMQLIKFPELRKQIALAAAESRPSFSIRNSALRIVKLYRELVPSTPLGESTVVTPVP